jgi:hypothetical protein
MLKSNGFWPAGGEYAARLTPAQADSLIRVWEERIAAVKSASRDAWARWESSFIGKYSTYGRELNAIVTAMLANYASASQASASTGDRRYLEMTRACPSGSGYFKGWLGPTPVIACFMPKAGLLDDAGRSYAETGTMGKWLSQAYSAKIWLQIRTLAQALATWEITAATVPQPRFSDELPPGLSHIARAGECLSDKACREKYALKFPDFGAIGGIFGTAMKWSLYLGGGYVGYKLLTAKRDGR